MKPPRKLAQALKAITLSLVRNNESRFAARLFTAFSQFWFRRRPISLYSRRLLEGIQPTNPLPPSNDLPAIGIVIAVAEKDFRTARIALESALMSSQNPVDEVIIVVPDGRRRIAENFLEGVSILEEEEIISPQLMQAISRNHPPERKGWIIQQVAGFQAALRSKNRGVLVLDSDTILLKKRAYITSSSLQILCFSHEYEPQYEYHAQKIWGPRRSYFGLSFVTHFQVMQPEILRAMFPNPESLRRWIEEGDATLRSPIADYHSYGRFILDNFPERVFLARWGNHALRWTDEFQIDTVSLIERIQAIHPHALSVSMHRYLDSRH